MICGDQAGRFVREDEFPRSRVNHLDNYSESKVEAEWLLRLTLPGFPLVVVRPSIIVDHTRLTRSHDNLAAQPSTQTQSGRVNCSHWERCFQSTCG